MSVVDPALQKYITAQVADITERGLPHRFELFHAGDEGRERLSRYELADYEDAEPGVIAQEVWDTAANNSDTLAMGMAQRYVLLTFRDEGDRENESSFAFIIRGRSNALGGGLVGESDSASPKGLLGQLMRHTEHSHALTQQMVVEANSALRRDNERLRSRVEHLEGQLGEMFEAREALMDRSHERELEKAREQTKAQRHEQMMGMLMSMAPLLASKFIGGKVVGGNAAAGAARDQGVMGFVSSLDESEIAAIFQALAPQKQATLLELLSSYKADHDQQEATKPEVLRSGH